MDDLLITRPYHEREHRRAGHIMSLDDHYE